MRSARISGAPRTIVLAAVAAIGIFALAPRAGAQPIPISQFAPTNIDIAVARTILQTVSQLPPVTNVGLSYQYDPQLDTFGHERHIAGLVSDVEERISDCLLYTSPSPRD